jgi:hypothetical protein
MRNRLVAVAMLAGVLMAIGSFFIIALPFKSHIRLTPTVSGTETQVNCGSVLHHPLDKRNGVTASERARACANGFTMRRFLGFALALVGVAIVVVSARALSSVEQNKKRRQQLPTPTKQP